MNSKIKGITVEIGGDTTKLSKSLADVTNKSKSLQSELKSVNNLLKLDPSNTELLSQKQKLLKDSISTTKEKLEQLKNVQDQIKKQYENKEIDEGAYRAFQRELVLTENKLKNLQSESDKFGGVISQKISLAGQKVQEFGGKIEAVGKKFSIVSGAAGAILAGSTLSASNFEDSMAKVSTIADTSQQSLEDLKTNILVLSDETGISCNDIAEDVYNAISAGQQTGDAVNFVSNSTALARAGFAETGDALDILTTIMNAYHMEADKVTNVSDMLIQTQNKGKTTVAELSSSMGKIIPTANSMNVGLEQVCAGYAIMTANGIATAESTTYMNSMFNELGKSSTKVGEILKKKTGKSFSELMASGKSVGEVLQILQDYSKQSGVAFNELWSSAEAGKAGITLLSNGVDGFNETAKGMVDSVGATNTAIAKLETPSHSAKVAMNQLKNAGVDLGTTVLSALAPVIEKISELIAAFTGWLSGFDENTRTVIVSILGAVAAIAPLLIALSKVTDSIKTITSFAPKIVSAFGKMKGVFSSTASKIALMGAGIMTVIQNISSLITNWGELDTKQKLLKAGMAALGVAAIALGFAIAKGISVATLGIGALIGLAAAAITAIVKITAKFMAEKDAILSTKDAQEKLTKAQEEYANATNDYVSAIDSAEESLKKLEEAEKQTGLSGEELYKSVENGTLDYANMTEQQREVYKAYLDNMNAQEALKTSSENLNNAKKEEMLASFANQLAIAAETGKYDEYKNSVVAAYQQGKLSTAEARDLIEQSMSRMSNSSQRTFVEDIPNDIREGLNPDKYQTARQKLTNWFSETTNDIKSVFSPLPNEMETIGYNIMRGLKRGISGKVRNVVNTARDVANSVKATVQHGLDINSPSRVMEAYGGYTSEGLAIGIKEKGHLASDAMENVVDTVVDKTNQSALLKLGINGPDTNIVNNSTPSRGDTIINFNGNYQFKDKTDIDYFMNEAGLRLAGVR